MEGIRRPLVDNIEKICENIDRNLRDLQRLIEKGHGLNEINLICEETEELIERLAANQEETLRVRYVSLFENLLETIDSVKKDDIKKIFFSALDNDIEDSKKNQIKYINDKIKMANGLFKECSETVTQQGMHLDRIDVEIASSAESNKLASFEIEKTNVTLSNQRKCFRFVLFSAVSIMLIVTFILIIKITLG